jgi:four helix bundle protein
MAYQSFEDLEIWKLARKFAGDIYQAVDTCRDYHFRNQINDAACSISNNIAEGSERIHRKEYIQFLNYSKGSAGEARNQLYLAEDFGYISAERAEQLRTGVRLIGGKLYALIRALGGS